jgi:ribonucleotide reductase alpha subunit
MSKGTFTHASPTLFNAGSRRAQLASCFLLKCEDDLEHIYETNKRSALISKYGGGIGIDITNVRSKGSVIHANNGKSDGLVPMCKVFNATANYSNQQGRRKGSIAMYLQPWHPDILEFLALRYNNPPEELRARELFTAMWIPDIFMRRVEADEIWSLIDPNTPCDIATVDMQRWIQITLSLNNKTCDVYIDGKLSRSCILPSFYKVDKINTKLTLCETQGFGGFISNTSMYNYALNPEQIWKLYMTGPGPQYSLWEYITSLFTPASALALDYPKKNTF